MPKTEFVKLPSGEIVVHRTLGRLGAEIEMPGTALATAAIEGFKKRIAAAKTRQDINQLYKEIDAWYKPARQVAKALSTTAAKQLDSAQASLMLALQAKEQELGFVPKLPTEPKSEIPWGTLALVGVGLVLFLTLKTKQ